MIKIAVAVIKSGPDQMSNSNVFIIHFHIIKLILRRIFSLKVAQMFCMFAEGVTVNASRSSCEEMSRKDDTFC
jgi:hypothetical protein